MQLPLFYLSILFFESALSVKVLYLSQCVMLHFDAAGHYMTVDISHIAWYHINRVLNYLSLSEEEVSYMPYLCSQQDNEVIILLQ